MRSIPKKVASSEAARHVSTVLWLAILALGFGVQSAPAQGTGSIQGKVTDPSGAPIFGAVVTVEGGGGSGTTVTDMEGAFRISLPPGNFNVKISASGMSDWTAESVAASARGHETIAGRDAGGADGDERDGRAVARRIGGGTG